MKLAINGLLGIQVAACAEILGMLARSEVTDEVALEILTGLPLTAPALQRVLARIAQRDYDPNFPVRLVAKDLRYLRQLARKLGAPTPITDATGDVYFAGAQARQAELDIVGIADRYLS